MLKKDNSTGKIAINPGPISFFTDVKDLCFDFNCGIRFALPVGEYDVRVKKLDVCTQFDVHAPGPAQISIGPLYFCHYGVELWHNGKIIWGHQFDAQGKNIHIEMGNIFTLPDIIASISAVELFRRKHNCTIYVTVREKYLEILKNAYPAIKFIPVKIDEEGNFEDSAWFQLPKDIYATYYLGLFTDDYYTPLPLKECGRRGMAAEILDVDVPEWIVNPLKESSNYKDGVPQEHYVCLGLYADKEWKKWHCPDGWLQVIAYLRQLGYRVLCLDTPDEMLHISNELVLAGAEDFTGKSLQEDIDILKSADFCVGLDNDISWLAWGIKLHSVLIAGTVRQNMHFFTPYTVCYPAACDYCQYIYADGEGCPKYAGTPRDYECSSLITAGNVCHFIDKVRENNDLYF